jgi:hypothetical protein
MNGFGILTFETNSSSDRYEGYFKSSKLNGNGSFYWKDESSYVLQSGSWSYVINNSIDGYEGYFKDREKDGNGTFYWKNGTKYVGEFKNDKMNGFGILTYPTNSSNDRYEGNY